MRPVSAVLAVGGLAGAMLVATTGPAAAAVAEDRAASFARYLLPGDFMVTKESCLRYARADYAKCRKLPPIPYVRQACWAAAAGKLAACIARSSG